ncbi:KPN_02809 family neutral zinc metallopeptidase [Pedobacter rhodius]|uniref:Zinc metallopeptidase n=1 Tax=Pedobacter rhodius TaxID=3004098 RepID=A0ABT4KZ32_9SPHI|nr:neutral zinc metallopeptidase [Pedobacter sp. SJ11]MCZ4224169.1 zinc metallopeptidase [Pedobacter sp. SJ11]
MQIFGKGSENVEDSRGSKGGGKAVLGGGVGLIIVVLGLFFGKDLTGLVGQIPTNEAAEVNKGIPTDSAGIQMSKILNSTDEVWEKEFQSMSKEYEKPTLRLFREGVQTACGNATADVGPFYCPGDNKVYIDLSFYDELANRFGAAGDFAQAYVLAHEVGHHVQNLLGISDKLQQARGKVSEADYNRLSVKLELQADFFAGLWAHNAQKSGIIKLDEGDLQEALTAANAIGDDKLQKQANGEVTPDSFTHGTSQQRMYWFKKGFETGDIKQGDTFNSNNL